MFLVVVVVFDFGFGLLLFWSYAFLLYLGGRRFPQNRNGKTNPAKMANRIIV
jgi:hypothetical protein